MGYRNLEDFWVCLSPLRVGWGASLCAHSWKSFWIMLPECISICNGLRESLVNADIEVAQVVDAYLIV